MDTHVYELIGLHCTSGGSDKVWAAAVYRQGPQWYYLAAYGPRGGRMSGEPKPYGEAAARKEYAAKLREKVAKDYRDIDIEDARYGLWPYMTSLVPGLTTVSTEQRPNGLFEQPAAGAATATAPATAPANGSVKVATPTKAGPRVVVSHLKTLPPEALKARMADPHWVLAEKANGVRCTVELTADGTLRSFNRLGQQNASVPESARALAQVGMPFLIDGEWLKGGEYAMFDLLEWKGESIRHEAFALRIEKLAALAEGWLLVKHGGPTLSRTIHTPGHDGLYLLQPTNDPLMKAELAIEIQQCGGEGFVLRDERQPSVAGNTNHELKVKFLAEIDVIAYSHKPGKSGGSLNVGLLRDDGALIHVGSVRGGLSEHQVQLLTQRTIDVPVTELPVMRVEYLPARTVGVGLVEPKVWWDRVRDDKRPTDCTTEQLVDQFGEERRAAIWAAARVR
jgi:hypothetical protein